MSLRRTVDRMFKIRIREREYSNNAMFQGEMIQYLRLKELRLGYRRAAKTTMSVVTTGKLPPHRGDSLLDFLMYALSRNQAYTSSKQIQCRR